MKKKLAVIITLILTLSIFSGCVKNNGDESKCNKENLQTESTKTVNLEDEKLMVYCGAGMKKPFEKITQSFIKQTGCCVNVSYANAAQIQTQINTSKEGDIFIAGAKAELKPVEKLVAKATPLVKHIPVLAVCKNNPKEITGLESLTQEGIVFITGDPKATPIGKIAHKALSDLGIVDKVQFAATTTTAPALVTALDKGQADATIVWKENVNVDGVEIVNTKELDKYIKNIPAAELTTATNEKAKDAFMEYLNTEEAQNIWKEFGYELAK